MTHIFDDDHSSTQQQVLPQKELPATIVQKPNPRLEKCFLFLADLCCKPQTRSQFTEVGFHNFVEQFKQHHVLHFMYVSFLSTGFNQSCSLLQGVSLI
jgi:hypothetical protein